MPAIAITQYPKNLNCRYTDNLNFVEYTRQKLPVNVEYIRQKNFYEIQFIDFVFISKSCSLKCEKVAH